MSVKGRSKGEILSFKIGKKFLYNNMLPKNIAAYLYLDERKVRGEEVRGEEVRREEVRGEEVRREEVRGEEVRREEVRREEVSDRRRQNEREDSG